MLSAVTGQCTPGGKVGQLIVTPALIKPPLGVNVIATLAFDPAAIVTGFAGPVAVKVPVFAFTVNVTLLEGPPPGAGFITVTPGEPAAAMAVAGIATMICVEVRDEGVRPAVVPKLTVAPLTKFVPLIVSVKPAPPAVALAGTNGAVIVGVGLFAAVSVKVTGAETLVTKLGSPL